MHWKIIGHPQTNASIETKGVLFLNKSSPLLGVQYELSTLAHVPKSVETYLTL